MVSAHIRTSTLILGLVVVGVVGFVVFEGMGTTPDPSMPAIGSPEPSLEILPDRMIAYVTASEAPHPATTTPDDPDDPDEPESDWVYTESLVLEQDAIISGFAVEIENADFHSLHHVRVGVADRPSTLCTIYYFNNNNSHDEIFTASQYTPDPVLLPSPYGLSVKKGELLSIEFVTQSLAGPHGSYDIEHSILPTLKVTMFNDAARTVEARYLRLRLDDTPCADPASHQAFVVPTSTESFKKRADPIGGSARYAFPKTGTILVAGGIFSPTKGGQNVTAYVNDSVIDVVEAVAGESSYEWRIPNINLNQSFSVGDTITISAEYQNPFETPIKDGSGMYGFYYSYGDPIVLQSASTTLPARK